MIEEQYPSEAWTHVYTDDQQLTLVTNGGAGIQIQFPGSETITASVATGKYCSNYRAETEAILQATSIIQDSVQQCTQVVFLTDALSVLQALQNSKLPHLSRAVHILGQTRRVVLQWIPAHCGITGNEKADVLAKEGAQKEQPEDSVSYSEQNH